MKPLTDKQKKAAWIAAGVLVVIHYAPSLVSNIRQQNAAYRAAHAKPSPVVVPPRVPSTPPPPPAPAPTTEELQATRLAASIGIWSGSIPRPNLGMCQLKIELKNQDDKNMPYLGYSTFSCANLAPFRHPQRSNPNPAGDAILDAVPVNAILKGRAINDSIELLQTEAIGYTREGCNITSITLTPFAEQFVATWHEGTKHWTEDPNAPNPCGDGHVMLSRVKTF